MTLRNPSIYRDPTTIRWLENSRTYCPKCKMIWGGNHDACPMCGGPLTASICTPQQFLYLAAVALFPDRKGAAALSAGFYKWLQRSGVRLLFFQDILPPASPTNLHKAVAHYNDACCILKQTRRSGGVFTASDFRARASDLQDVRSLQRLLHRSAEIYDIELITRND